MIRDRLNWLGRRLLLNRDVAFLARRAGQLAGRGRGQRRWVAIEWWDRWDSEAMDRGLFRWRLEALMAVGSGRCPSLLAAQAGGLSLRDWGFPALVALLLVVAGCRGFNRAEVAYRSPGVAYTTTAVGWRVGPTAIWAGSYFDIAARREYVLVGGELEGNVNGAHLRLVGEGYVPEGGGRVEYFGSFSVEVPW